MKRWRWWVIVAIAVASFAGCSTLGYYYQAARGQLALSHAARPIEQVINDPQTQEDTKRRLETARAIREFASRELGLPQNNSYRKYADLKRPFVVWNVFAAPEFSTVPREWCFPVAGCVGYKGWFDAQRAEQFAAEVKREGYDVFVYGVPAYSTLGWFDDPLLNTYIRYPRAELARLIFHELAHQVVYAPGDSTFNESFATAVEEEGVRRWLKDTGGAGELEEFEAMGVRKDDFVALVSATRARLDVLYAQPLDPTSMRAAKQSEFERMRRDYAALKHQWGGFSGYDRWFAQSLSNAHLASVATYEDRVRAFQHLLRGQGRDLSRFYVEAKRLAQLKPTERAAALNALENEAN